MGNEVICSLAVLSGLRLLERLGYTLAVRPALSCVMAIETLGSVKISSFS